MKDLSMFIIGLSLVIITIYITKVIEKHSVHPIYGNYKKIDSNQDRCSPWEACK